MLITLIGASAAFIVAYLIYNKPHPDYTSMPAEQVVRADSLYFSYAGATGSADALYLDKVVEVHGVLNRVDPLDSTAVAVFVVEEGMCGEQGVRCTFHPDHAARALELLGGEEVAIKGYLTGFNQTDVILEKCILME